MYKNYIPSKLKPDYAIQRPTFNDLFTVDDLKTIFDVNHDAQIRGKAKERLANKWIWQKVSRNNRVGFIRIHCVVTAVIMDAIEADLLAPVKAVDAYHSQNFYLDRDNFEELVGSFSYAPRYERAAALYNLPPQYPDLPIQDYLTVTDVRLRLRLSRETVYKFSTLRGLDELGRERPLRTVEYCGRHFWLPSDVDSFDMDDYLTTMEAFEETRAKPRKVIIET